MVLNTTGLRLVTKQSDRVNDEYSNYLWHIVGRLKLPPYNYKAWKGISSGIILPCQYIWEATQSASSLYIAVKLLSG